jgi:hypothetical protein
MSRRLHGRKPGDDRVLRDRARCSDRRFSAGGLWSGRTNGQFGRVARRGGDSVEKGAWGDGRRITAAPGKATKRETLEMRKMRPDAAPPAHAAIHPPTRPARACLPPDA